MCRSGSIYKKTNRSTLDTVNSVNSPGDSILTTNRYCRLQTRSFLRKIQTKFRAFLLSQLQVFQIFVKNWLKMKQQGKTFPLQPDLPLLYVFQKCASYHILEILSISCSLVSFYREYKLRLK